jgi:hypothetical protein
LQELQNSFTVLKSSATASDKNLGTQLEKLRVEKQDLQKQLKHELGEIQAEKKSLLVQLTEQTETMKRKLKHA